LQQQQQKRLKQKLFQLVFSNCFSLSLSLSLFLSLSKIRVRSAAAAERFSFPPFSPSDKYYEQQLAAQKKEEKEACFQKHSFGYRLLPRSCMAAAAAARRHMKGQLHLILCFLMCRTARAIGCFFVGHQ
jgi:hypothetical protein